ncbi:MAG: hypothetical protein ACI4UE_05230 [Candidatus Scatovivens sp.]
MVKIARKYKRRKISKKALVVAIIICLIVMVIILVESLNKIKETDEDNKKAELSEVSEADLVQDDLSIYRKYNCKDVSKKYTTDNFKVNLSFGKDLYSKEGESNQEYFESLINELVKVYKRSFQLVDEDKDITIEVNYISETNYFYKINSKENYFNDTEEKNNEIKNYKEIEAIQNKVSYEDFNKFNKNEWSVQAAGVEIKEKSNGILDYGTYKILTDNIFTNTIIMNNEFKDEIIEGIKVGDSFNSIKQKLGNPTFEKTNMIGYKTDDEYIFFYNDEVAIYPNIKFSNLELEELIQNYIKGIYDGERKEFAFDILHKYYDFKSYIDNNNSLNLESATRGIKIKISDKNQVDINIYNNYDMTETTKKYIREGKINTNFETDLIYETEINRK